MNRWSVVYERHFWNELYKTSRFESSHFVPAWLVYRWWELGYIFSALPVKRLVIYRTTGDTAFMAHRSKSFNRDQLIRLKNRRR